MQNYYAHTPAKGSQKWHRLKAHLIKTGKRAGSYARDPMQYFLLNFTGLMHDLGKYQTEFQKYLEAQALGNKHPKVPHAMLGAAAAEYWGATEAVFAIAGHHMGIPNASDLRTRYFPNLRSLPQSIEELLDIFKQDTRLDPHFFMQGYEPIEDTLELETTIRYVFSCLVDADWLDSERHFDRRRSRLRKKLVFDVDKMQAQLKQRFASFAAKGTINELRNSAREEAMQHAKDTPGFFSLVLPTGLGKTLTSIAWALEHASIHKLQRIIIVLPYTNIIDQTAQELAKIFGRDAVLEHHSNVIEETNEERENSDLTYDQKKLATENWEHPLIVTTTVQFFESLFSNKPSKCRKVHNIADAVVIFDEVQTLPKGSIRPTLRMLQNIHDGFGTSFLFCTATMPAFEKNNNFRFGIEKIQPLLQDTQRLFSSTERVDFHFLNGLQEIEFSDLIERIENINESLLIVFNAKKDALRCFDGVKLPSHKKFHLSTSMCPAHRKTTLKIIRRSLKRGLKTLVVSTQLIEAGVDVDFPVVFRALAPLDSIIQAGGRCNREGKMPKNGHVYIFRTKDMGMPFDKTYQTATEFTRVFLDGREDEILSPEIYQEYFASLLRNFVNDDKAGIDGLREELQFKDVAEHYKIIDSPAITVFIKDFSRKSRKLYAALEHKPFLETKERRILQQYSVQLYQNLFNQALASGYLNQLKNGLWVWSGKYDRHTGIVTQQGDLEFVL